MNAMAGGMNAIPDGMSLGWRTVNAIGDGKQATRDRSRRSSETFS
jgi:hypothetical protein